MSCSPAPSMQLTSAAGDGHGAIVPRITVSGLIVLSGADVTRVTTPETCRFVPTMRERYTKWFVAKSASTARP